MPDLKVPAVTADKAAVSVVSSSTADVAAPPSAAIENGAMILGVAASAGLARGPAFICHCDEAVVVPRRAVADAEMPQEIEKLEAALRAADGELRTLQNQIQQRSGSADAAIFAAQAEMLHDPMLRKEITQRCLRSKINVEAAVSDAAEKLTAAFSQIDDPVFRERAADVRDVARRLLGHLLHHDESPIRDLPAGSIIVARELLPSLAASLGQNKVRGLVAERGGATAHAVILARSLGIPTVIHADGATQRIKPNDQLIVDGLAGRVFINPTAGIRREYDRLQVDLDARRNTLKNLVDVPAVTTDGVAIRLSANVGMVADAAMAAAFGAEGIGLYRTEFAFFAHAQFPTEEQQYQIYRTAADHVRPGHIVLRILDVGSDKLLPYFPLPVEVNPSLGRRGTRLLLGHPEILRTQLRAVLRLSATHPVSLLFPMIGGVEEFAAARAAVESAKEQLRQEEQPFNPRIPVGAMIETPSAAVTARWIAREADFLSIGSNDLVQYLLTTDRTSMEMAAYYEPLHPAVIQSLKSVFDAAATEGKAVSLCGEIAGNPAYTALLLGLGARCLSVAPGELLEIKRVVRSVDLGGAERLARQALAAGTIKEIKACLTEAANATLAKTRGP
jgi:phosphotransferase system enzyme I (PtsI)